MARKKRPAKPTRKAQETEIVRLYNDLVDNDHDLCGPLQSILALVSADKLSEAKKILDVASIKTIKTYASVSAYFDFESKHCAEDIEQDDIAKALVVHINKIGVEAYVNLNLDDWSIE